MPVNLHMLSSTPPGRQGAAPHTISRRGSLHLQALDARKSAKMARCYYDWDDMLKNNKDGQVNAAACPLFLSSGLHRMRLHLKCIP